MRRFNIISDSKLLFSVVLALSTGAVSAEWVVEAGPWYRGDMRIRVEGGSRAAESGRQVSRPGVAGGFAAVDLSGNADDGSAQILRFFDDGFVGPSGLPLFFNDGQTAFFGFQSDSQHDAGSGTLTFTRTLSGQDSARRTVTTLNSEGGTWRDAGDLDGAGVNVRLGRVLVRREGLDVSAQLQGGWLGGIDRTLQSRNAFRQTSLETIRETRSERAESTRFVYDTFGNPVFPSAPYAMEDPEGTGPLLSDTPIAVLPGAATQSLSDQVTGRRQQTAVSQVRLQSEAELFVFGLGPRIRWTVTDTVSLFVEGGGTLNLLDASLRRSETFAVDTGRVLGQWSDRADEQKWLWGASFSLGAQWRLNDRLHLSVAGGYDWVESTRIAVGPDRVTYDLSGYQVDLVLGWRFGNR
ncbi:MAG: hypothetical protein JJU05_13245 [Verrucomicrobia bacterium]|nr:hypothetical protein [Verrucomicrobiota bacterium]MCH8527947.1 hypothetical protein [Kiritimatiellia bacterium]